MDFERTLALLAILVHWRVALSLFATVAIALALNYSVLWFSGIQCIVIGLSGLWLGLAWNEATSIRSRATAATSPTTTPVTGGLAALLAGAAWGAISAQSLASIVAGAGVLALIAWPWAYLAGRHRGSARETIFASVACAAVAYPVAALLSQSAA